MPSCILRLSLTGLLWAACLASSSPLPAQVRAAQIRPAQIVVRGSQTQVVERPTTGQSEAAELVATQPNADSSSAADETKGQESPQQALLKQLLAADFKRTTESILKAWSEREIAAQPLEPVRPKVWQAKVLNAYEDVVIFEFESDVEFKSDQHLTLVAAGQPLGTAQVLSVNQRKVVATLTPLATADSPQDAAEFQDAATIEKPTAMGDDADVAATQESSETAADVATVGEPESAEASQTESPKLPQLETGVVLSIQLKASSAQDQDATRSIPEQVKALVRDVTLGQWDDVRKFLKAMDPDDADKVYAHILESLATSAPSIPEGVPPEMAAQIQAQMEQSGQIPPTSFLTPDDILQLCEASPKPIRVSTRSRHSQLASGDGISGKWQGQILMDELPPESRDFSMTLKWDGRAVTGSITANGETIVLEPGTFDPVSGSLSIVANDEEAGLQIPLRGTIKENRLTGSLEVEGQLLNVEAERVEPAEGHVLDKSTAVQKVDASVQLPAGVKLAPGMTLEDLPPEALAKLKKQTSEGADSDAGDSSHIEALANLVRNAQEAGHDFTDFVQTLQRGTTHFGSQDTLKRLTTAQLLLQAGLTEYVEQFLPPWQELEDKQRLVALEIGSEHALAKYAEKRAARWLEQAWEINQEITALESVEAATREAALARLIELAPQVKQELGAAWMNASFSENPERGVRILSRLGTQSAAMASQAAATSEQARLKLLRLQNEAVESLVAISPENAKAWHQALTLLAQNWLKEAETTIEHSQQSSRGEFMQIDMYGNYYWVDQNQYAQQYGNRQMPRAIKPGDMLEITPSREWQALVNPSLKNQFQRILANLHLRVNEEDKAFPYIEQIATLHPQMARDLVHEFLQIWTQNHDPNTDKRQRNPYIYLYGFDQKAEAIPLTRSKQERNLQELTGWVERIRQLPIEDIDETLLADAFTTCHSSAEVFRLDRVQSVFGDLADLKPETVAALCQKMRANLASNWRDIREQEAKQTNRREPEVQQEVLRGYAVARQLADQAIAVHPESWQLQLATACLMFDENSYTQTVQKSSEFSDKRDQAFEQFQVAASKYASLAANLEAKDQSTDPYDYWFYASLGACDLGRVTNKTVPDQRQYPLIREALNELPGSLAEIHLAKFANNLFTRMSPVKPEIKFRYLRAGFEVVGDHPRAWEASQLYDYYRDLVSEIKLDVSIDGDDNVGHDQPFGVYVNILHTTEIERESGGFGKYVQNQNSLMFAYNYGRPTEDYRDKFNDMLNQALGEHFEVLSVTFQSPDTMQSRPALQPGWRVTPYAYVLLKPVGPQVDRIAPLKLDLDFLDTSGYVIIPVESPAVVVDASAPRGTPRPIEDLQVTQTLDERQADEGKLIVEISASGQGLIPELDQIIDLQDGAFQVVSVDDQGVLPAAFDKETDAIQILSDRSWTVEYQAPEGAGDVKQFSFAALKIPDANMSYQRYQDADLVAAEPTVSLERAYGSFSWNFLYWLIPLLALVLATVGVGSYLLTRPEEIATHRFRMPTDVNPFTVLTLLQDIKEHNGVTATEASELQASIDRVERAYFGDAEQPQETKDLEALARRWVNRVS